MSDKKVEELRKELEKVKERLPENDDAVKGSKEVKGDKESVNDKSNPNQGSSRRNFLKSTVAGVTGLGAAALLPSVSSYEIRSDEGFAFRNLTSSQPNFEVRSDGDLDLHGNRILNLRELPNDAVLDVVNSDPDHGSTASHDYFSGAPSDLSREGAAEGDVLAWNDSSSEYQPVSSSSDASWNVYRDEGLVGTDTSGKEFVDSLPARSDQQIEVRKTWCNIVGTGDKTTSFKVHLQESANQSNNHIINGETFNLSNTTRLTVDGKDGVTLNIYLENDTGSEQHANWGFEWRWV